MPCFSSNGGITCQAGKMVHKPAQKKDGRHSRMTTRHAIKVVQEIVHANRENEELEGILNRHRIAALNHLLSIAKTNKEGPQAGILLLNPPA
jgi:hypothetical protein